jgi:hypothetical protein
MKKSSNLIVKNSSVSTSKMDNELFISLTDMARNKNPEEPKDVVKNWMRSRTTIEFLGIWEQLNNPDFKGVEFDSLLFEAGSNSFTLSPTKWVELTDAKGIISKRGKNGGTYAHQDIALEFASWISAEFKIYLLKEFKRLKQEEFNAKELEWNLTRTLAKVNYHIHTDAIKGKLIPENIEKISFVYADEADLLNLALFGKTAKKWRDDNPDKSGNIRDYSTMEQLVVLSNLESMNAELIKSGIEPHERMKRLNKMAISQMKVLIENTAMKKLK